MDYEKQSVVMKN